MLINSIDGTKSSSSKFSPSVIILGILVQILLYIVSLFLGNCIEWLSGGLLERTQSSIVTFFILFLIVFIFPKSYGVSSTYLIPWRIGVAVGLCLIVAPVILFLSLHIH